MMASQTMTMTSPLPVPPLLLAKTVKCKIYIDCEDHHHFSRIHHSRREEIRRQRIELDQRRRDELRDGYRRLKHALPISNQKYSKVSLLDGATTHIKYLEMTQQQVQTRLQQAEDESARLRKCVHFLGDHFIMALTMF
jgi:Helix-loop-helix DNA-binding domain